MERQALAITREFSHTSHGNKNAQAPVVLATIAHSVVVRTCHHSFSVRLVRFVYADDIANGVYLDVIKAASLHAEFYRARTFAMRICEVGDG